MIEKPAYKSLTIYGALTQFLASLAVILQITDEETVINLMNMIYLGIGGFMQLVGLFMVYLGRKNANSKIYLFKKNK